MKPCKWIQLRHLLTKYISTLSLIDSAVTLLILLTDRTEFIFEACNIIFPPGDAVTQHITSSADVRTENLQCFGLCHPVSTIKTIGLYSKWSMDIWVRHLNFGKAVFGSIKISFWSISAHDSEQQVHVPPLPGFYAFETFAFH